MKKISILITSVLFLMIISLPVSAVDTLPYKKSQRPPILLEKNNGIYKIKDMRWGFDVVNGKESLEHPKWRTVTIDTNHVKKAILCVKLFPPEWLAGHCLMLYRFDSNYPVKTSLGETSKGLFVSVEAHLREDQTYGIIAGMKKQWPTIWLLTSYEDYVQLCSIAGRKMMMFELEMSPEMVKHMLVNSLNTAVKDHEHIMYHTLYESCYTSQVDMINSVVEKKRRLRRSFLSKYFFNPLLSLPKGIKVSLKRKHLLRKEYPILNPKNKNKRDIATKEIHGPNRSIAIKNINFFQIKSKKVESIIIDGINSSAINKEQLYKLLYNTTGEYSPYLHIPGVMPGEADNGETVLGENFGISIKRASSKEELVSIIEKGFTIYRKGIARRLILEGPDIGKFLGRNLSELRKRSEELVKSGKLNR